MRASFASILFFFTTILQVLATKGKKHHHGGGPPRYHNGSWAPDHTLHLTYQNVSIGCQTRTSVLINGTLPGPPLRLPPGRTSWIRVYNDMSEFNATIHWHGLSQRAAIFSDGTPAASQWEIPPLHYFDYEVHPEHDDAGTYFYHSHVGFQALTASGPLIIEDIKEPPFAYDEEVAILLGDYFNKSDTTIETGLTSNPFTWSGETMAVLVNGVGVAVGEQAGVDGCELPVINVEPDKTYRMRFIGATALSMVQFAIEEHNNFTVIEADGSYTKPHLVSFMQLSSGQRFDAIFKTKSASELNGKTDFLIQFETKERPAVYYGYGVLRYGSAAPTITKGPTTPPMALSNATYSWLEYALEPLKPNNFPSAKEVTRRITITDQQVATDTIIWRLNGDQWNTSTIQETPGNRPYLVNIYDKGPNAIPDYESAVANGGWDPVTYTWPAKIGEVLEIIWVNTGSLVNNGGGVDYHPFHAHGGHFYDIGSGNGTYNPKANEKKLKIYNPVLRDTTNLYRYGTATTPGANAGWRGWRLRVEDAGVWMIHCHILQHMTMGMQSVWVMGEYEDIARIPQPYVAGYLEYGGSAYGNASYDPLVLHQLGE